LGDEAEEALPAMIRSLEDSDRRVRIAVVYAVVNFGKRAVAAIPILESWLPSDDEFSVVAAAAAIIQIDPSRADDVLPILVHTLKSDDYGIRCHAAWSTGQLGQVARNAVPALRQIRGEESTLGHLASEAITNITGEEL
jgi:HEAT repeat protein